MPRPKKTKAEAVQGLGAGTTSTSTGLTEQEEASASNQVEEDGGTLEDCEEESDKEARQQTNKFVKSARSEVHAAAVDVRKAEAVLRHEERDKRWWVAEQRDKPPPAYLQLERAYKGQVKMLQARLALSEAQKGAAEADARLQECLLMREELAHALTRDASLSRNVCIGVRALVLGCTVDPDGDLRLSGLSNMCIIAW